MKTLVRLRLAIVIITLLTCFQTFAYAQQVDGSYPAGRWYMNASTTRMIFRFEKVNNVWRGAGIDEQGKTTERIENITWDNKTRTLEFLRIGSGYWQWYRGKIVEGVLVARYTHNGKTDSKPTDPLAYKWKATGWNFEYLTPAMAPLVFDIVINETGYRARLRIDRAPGTANGYVGRLKYYAQDNICSEGLENDITIEQWDGVNLRFRAFNVNIYKDLNMVFTGKVNAYLIEGTLVQTQNDGQRYNHTFRGTRAEVLTYGFSGKTATARDMWQARARRQLEHLMMAGNPAPLKTEVRIIRDSLPPILGTAYEGRDDNPNAYPQNYRLSEFNIRYTLANPFGGAALTRDVHGFISKPSSTIGGATRGMGRRPLVIAINGHGGSAFQTFDPNSVFWYGDAFARQGYTVMAIDTSHRPVADLVFSGGHFNDIRMGYFNDLYARGDDLKNGNRARSSIKTAVPADMFNPELYTDWEEDGERLWDLRRAIDYAVSRPDVDPTRIIIVGLSLGGELAAYLGALDPRVSVSIVAGFSPDISVLKYQGSHGCWNWHYADIREYIDSSELFALIAPRPLLIETGKQDYLYHCMAEHYSSDKQIARRVRSAYSDAQDKFVHYLHSDFHIFRAGGPHAKFPDRYVRVPVVLAPRQAGDQLWQTDDATWSPKQWTVFQYISSWMNLRTLY